MAFGSAFPTVAWPERMPRVCNLATRLPAVAGLFYPRRTCGAGRYRDAPARQCRAGSAVPQGADRTLTPATSTRGRLRRQCLCAAPRGQSHPAGGADSGAGASASCSMVWRRWEPAWLRTPLGDSVDDLDALASLPDIEVSPRAHAHEHSLEVQLPFLQKVVPHAQIGPLLAGLDRARRGRSDTCGAVGWPRDSDRSQLGPVALPAVPARPGGRSPHYRAGPSPAAQRRSAQPRAGLRLCRHQRSIVGRSPASLALSAARSAQLGRYCWRQSPCRGLRRLLFL